MCAVVYKPTKSAADEEVPRPECGSFGVKTYDLVNCYAKKHGVPLQLAHYIVKNESNYDINLVGDMNITCARTGKPVRARGLMQITECYYPEVSDEQAFDPNFNLDFGMSLAKNKKTCISQFSTCRNYYKKLEASVNNT